jgi:glycosyltransferase involved in cell wall biosynthesis
VYYYNRIFRPLYRRCSAIICVSEFTRREFIEWSGVAPEKVFTVYNGVSEAFFSRQAGVGSDRGFPYILYPGNRRAHKNLVRLVQAYARSSLPSQGVRLLLTGASDPKLLEAAGDPRAAALICFAGNLSQNHLVHAYQNALFVVLVSLEEGFGLPIVEAMAAEVPVVTSDRSSMAEIADGAALLVNPYSIDEIAAAFEKLAGDDGERSRLVALGRTRVADFDWNVAAEKTWNIVSDVTRMAV